MVVWDDFVNEPLAALLSEASGLLTPNSFDRLGEGIPRIYPNVDAVVLLRHLHQLVRGTQNNPPTDERANFLDYGSPGRFPPNALVPCPDGRPLEPILVDALSAVPINERRQRERSTTLVRPSSGLEAASRGYRRLSRRRWR